MCKSYTYMKRMMVAMAVVVMSFTAVHAQIPQSQLKTDSDEQLLREWVKVLASMLQSMDGTTMQGLT